MNVSGKLKVAKNLVTSKVGRQLLRVESHSPTLLLAAGSVTLLASTVFAAKATLRLEETTEEFNTLREDARVAVDDPSKPNYNEKDFKHDLTLIFVKKSVAVGKLYFPAIALGVVGYGCIFSSHRILNRRYAGVVAAYAALDKGFRDYRGRVVEKYGQEVDNELRYGLEDREIVEDGPNGPEVKTVKSATDYSPSIYAVTFDRQRTSWSPVPIYNETFLKAKQMYANDMLRARGHVFLNEIYDDLGFDRTEAGAVVGWVKGHGDDYIDFYPKGGFIPGEDGSILLDFNVDGIILKLIEKDKKNKQ